MSIFTTRSRGASGLLHRDSTIPEQRDRYSIVSQSAGSPIPLLDQSIIDIVDLEDAQMTAYESQGVRFIPGVVLFNNAFRGQTYSATLKLLNISDHVVHVSIRQPYSSAFFVKDSGLRTSIAPGMSITRKIIYKCVEGYIFDSKLPLKVDGIDVHIQIKVKQGRSFVTVSPSTVNFGKLDVGSPFVTRTLRLANMGSISTKFSIDVGTNDLDLMISPRSGTLKPYGCVTIRVQLAGLIVGEHSLEFWIKTTPPSRFIVNVTVVVPYFSAIHPFATGEFTLIDLKMCFPGTESYDTLIVRNVSSSTSAFVILAECEGQPMTFHEARKSDPSFDTFTVEPDEGEMIAFEGRIFTVWFRPKIKERRQGWKHQPEEDTIKTISFVRIQRVDVISIDTLTTLATRNGDVKSLSSNGKHLSEVYDDLKDPSRASDCWADDDFEAETTSGGLLRLCLYGLTVKPRYTALPDELIFMNASLREPVTKTLILKNESRYLSLAYRYVKIPHIEVEPQFKFLDSGQSEEVLVTLKVNSFDFKHTVLRFEMVSYKNLTDVKGLTVVGDFTVSLKVIIKSSPKEPVPTFLPGISPKTNKEGHEVGLFTELVTFDRRLKAGIPKSIVMPGQGDVARKPWLKSNARIAFPNDKRRSFRVTPHDLNVKTIFTGLPRYNVPKDSSLVMSDSELVKKRDRVTYFRQLNHANFEAYKKRNLESQTSLQAEYSVSDVRLYKLLRMPPPSSVTETEHTRPSTPEVGDYLCPLTPMNLYNIRVKPSAIDFGKMPPNVPCSSLITIENLNNFPIGVQLKVYKDVLKVEKGQFMVPANGFEEKLVILTLGHLGKHYTNMSYIINTFHSYDLKVCAEVVQRYLEVTPGEISFHDVNIHDIYQVKSMPIRMLNPLSVPTDFTWKVSDGSSFDVFPLEGTVPGRKEMICTVSINLKDITSLGTVFSLVVQDGQPIQFPVNYIMDTNNAVRLFTPKLSCPHIPLGLTYKRKIIIFNAGMRDCYFSVVPSPKLEGIEVRPLASVVKARSCSTLSVSVKLFSVTKFNYRINLLLQMRSMTELKCNGYVIFPKIRYEPQRLVFRSTPMHSYATKSVHVINECKGEILLNWDMSEYSQFIISSSKNYRDPGCESLIVPPESKKKMYVHFQPSDLSSYEFLMPYVLNGFIGPAVVNDRKSLFISTYLAKPKREQQPSMLTFPGMEVSKQVETIHVDCTVAKAYIKISTTDLNFFITDLKQKGIQTLVIQNMSIDSVNVGFDVSTVIKTPFRLTTVDEVPLSNDVWYPINPDDEMKVMVTFKPSCAGSYVVEFPIKVEEYDLEKPYTVVKLSAIFFTSTIMCSHTSMYFLPVPLDFEIDREIEIIANHQPANTQLKALIIADNGDSISHLFTLVYPSTDVIKCGEENFTVPVKIKFKSSYALSVSGVITFTDGFDGECSVRVCAVADVSLLTTYTVYCFTHGTDWKETDTDDMFASPFGQRGPNSLDYASDSTNRMTSAFEEIHAYPMFPLKTSESLYATNVRRTLDALESWVFYQGFAAVYRPVIGEPISFSNQFLSAFNSKHKDSNFQNVKSIVDFIVNFTGREFVKNYPLPPSIPRDEEGRIGYAVRAYKNVLQFVQKQGGYLPHVCPAYLLDYDDFQYYVRYLRSQMMDIDFEESYLSYINDEFDYNRFCKQFWMDLFLQLFKVLILPPLVLKRMDQSDSHPTLLYSIDGVEQTKVKKGQKTSRFSFFSVIEDPLYDKAEPMLLSWLNDIYAEKRRQWSRANPKLSFPPRQVNNLVQDLEDCVILIGVTAYYCPYLTKEYLGKAFLSPNDTAQFQHNAGILVMAWDTIKLGLPVAVKDFINPNPVAMIILISHLYQVLPSYHPYDSIQFGACLNSTITRTISLKNPSNKTVGFAVKKIGDEKNNFKVSPRGLIKIIPGKSMNVSIHFVANSVFKVKATVLFCGQCLPGGYSSNVVFTLLGEAKKLQSKLVLNINCPLYKSVTIQARLLSPFNSEADYEIWYAETEPKPGKLRMKKWASIKNRKIPRIVFINCSTVTIPGVLNSPAILPITVACYTLKVHEFWLIFMNQEVGNFIVKICVTPRLDAPACTIKASLPNEPCVEQKLEACTHDICPRRVWIHIPARNERLWNVVSTMLRLTLTDLEREFWDKYLETPIGLKLIKWILSQYGMMMKEELEDIFHQKATYSVESSSPMLEPQSSVVITDVHDNGVVGLRAHLRRDAHKRFSANLKLTSQSKREIRFYQVTFEHD